MVVLPSEAWEQIFGSVWQLQALIACELTCRLFWKVISGSIYLRYLKELQAAHRIDCYPANDPTPYDTRLQRLFKSEDAWKYLLLTRLPDLTAPKELQGYRSGAENSTISQGLLIRRMMNHNAPLGARSALCWLNLHISTHHDTEPPEISEKGSGYRFCHFPRGQWLADLSSDLLVTVSESQATDGWEIIARVSSLRTGSPCSQTAPSVYHLVSIGGSGEAAASLSQSGDAIVVLVFVKSMVSHIISIDWKTGLKEILLLEDFLNYSEDIIFLSDDIFALLRLDLGAIELWTIRPFARRLLFSLYRLNDGFTWSSISILSSHPRVDPRATQDSHPFSPDQGIFVLYLMLNYDSEEMLVIDKAALLHLAQVRIASMNTANTVSIPWEEWGPRHSRCLDIRGHRYCINGPRILIDIPMGEGDNPTHDVTLFDFSTSVRRRNQSSGSPNQPSDLSNASFRTGDDPSLLSAELVDDPSGPNYGNEILVQTTLPYWRVTRRFYEQFWMGLVFNESHVVAEPSQWVSRVYAFG